MVHFQVTEEKSLKYEPIRLDKRKCGIFLVLVFLLALAIVVGSLALYGSGRIGNITRYGKGIPASINTNTLPLCANVASTPAPIVYVPDTYEVKFELDSTLFSPTLADQRSEEFKTLSRVLEEKLRDSISYKYGRHFTLKLIKFESSSTNATSATVRIRWQMDQVEGNKYPTIKDVTEQLENYINVREGHIGGHHIRSKSLNVEDLIDECYNKNRTSCTHICDFQTTTLMFKCSCPDNLILQDGHICVDRSSVKATEKPNPVNIASMLNRAKFAGGEVFEMKYEDKKTVQINETLINGTNSSMLQSNNADKNNADMLGNGTNSTKTSIK